MGKNKGTVPRNKKGAPRRVLTRNWKTTGVGTELNDGHLTEVSDFESDYESGPSGRKGDKGVTDTRPRGGFGTTSVFPADGSTGKEQYNGLVSPVFSQLPTGSLDSQKKEACKEGGFGCYSWA